MKKVIRIGDPTSHGGTVLSGSPYRILYKKNVARMGDIVSCPQNGHTNCVIIEGDPSWLVDGKPVALEGHLTSCGAVLFSTLKEVEVEVQVSPSAVVEGAKAAIAATAAVAATKALAPYDEQTKLVSGLIEGVPYFIETKDGQIISGRIGADGKLPRIDTKDESEYSILWGDEALEKMGDK